ncbi:hypothetical protein DFH06DRAFT_1377098 [Mycena polygramma]|nr:hypothetical protein DFH06DRAFT_1377098 [Mycena polygramma]
MCLLHTLCNRFFCTKPCAAVHASSSPPSLQRRSQELAPGVLDVTVATPRPRLRSLCPPSARSSGLCRTAGVPSVRIPVPRQHATPPPHSHSHSPARCARLHLPHPAPRLVSPLRTAPACSPAHVASAGRHPHTRAHERASTAPPQRPAPTGKYHRLLSANLTRRNEPSCIARVREDTSSATSILSSPLPVSTHPPPDERALPHPHLYPHPHRSSPTRCAGGRKTHCVRVLLVSSLPVLHAILRPRECSHSAPPAALPRTPSSPAALSDTEKETRTALTRPRPRVAHALEEERRKTHPPLVSSIPVSSSCSTPHPHAGLFKRRKDVKRNPVLILSPQAAHALGEGKHCTLSHRPRYLPPLESEYPSPPVVALSPSHPSSPAALLHETCAHPPTSSSSSSSRARAG